MNHLLNNWGFDRIFIAICFLFIFLGLDAQELKPNPVLSKVRIQLDQVRIEVEVARTAQEMAQGLMFRDFLSDNSGMIFCLPEEKRASFWMKNVKIPLSVAYIDRSGKILEIHDMKPFDLNPVFSRSDRIYYALEMNQGWFALHKIQPGTVLKVEGKSIDFLRR